VDYYTKELDILILFDGKQGVYTLGEFHKEKNNSTEYEELSVSIVDFTVANICFSGSASRRQ
jgi:hypothetical protein